MKDLLQLIKNNARQYGMLGALAIIMLLFQISTRGVLMKPINLTNLVLQNSYILILAIGMLLVILSGNIDLSVGSIVAFVGAFSSVLMVDYKVNFLIAIIASLILGALIGLWQGYWIAYFKIPSFIVTLAGMLMFRGFTLVILKGQSKGPFPDYFRAMSSGFLPDFGKEGVHTLTIVIGIVLSLSLIVIEFYNRRQQNQYGFEVLPIRFVIMKIFFLVIIINYFSYLFSTYRGFPNLFIIIFTLLILYSFLVKYTVPGRHLYALGGNIKAAKLSGVKTEKVLLATFINMGILSALAGMVFAARLNVATPKAGVGFELDAIAACFIGGASTAGGVGTVIGAIIGGLVMGVLNNGMSIMGVSIDWQQAIKGFVLLAAVIFDLQTKSKGKI